MVKEELLLFPAGQTVTSSTASTSSSSSQTSSSFSFSTSGPMPPSANAPPTQNQAEAGGSEPQPQEIPPDISQLMSSLLGGASGGAPSITVTTSGVPAFLQGMSEFMQQVGVCGVKTAQKR